MTDDEQFERALRKNVADTLQRELEESIQRSEPVDRKPKEGLRLWLYDLLEFLEDEFMWRFNPFGGI
jgi:hypothetical protein